MLWWHQSRGRALALARKRELHQQWLSTTQQQSESVALMVDDYDDDTTNRHLSPLLICHGMLGSRHNWTSMAKQIHRLTGRRVLTVDARNHGDSPHTEHMSYPLMAGDILSLVKDRGLGARVSLMGHSMGGRTVMMLACMAGHQLQIDRMVLVDISPVNQGAKPIIRFEVIRRYL